MLATIHHHIAASCAVFAQEHADDTYDPPLSGTAATPHPLSSPPRGEGHPSALTPLLTTSHTSSIQIGRNVALTAERSLHLRGGSHDHSSRRVSTWVCATKRTDVLGGNPHCLYRQAMSPWGVAASGCKLAVKQLPLKGTGEARCKPPRGRAWLRTHTVSTRRYATKHTDTMEGNSRRLYQGGCEPLGRSG